MSGLRDRVFTPEDAVVCDAHRERGSQSYSQVRGMRKGRNSDDRVLYLVQSMQVGMACKYAGKLSSTPSANPRIWHIATESGEAADYTPLNNPIADPLVSSISHSRSPRPVGRRAPVLQIKTAPNVIHRLGYEDSVVPQTRIEKKVRWHCLVSPQVSSLRS